MSDFALLGLSVFVLLGFVLGYWAARKEEPNRRLLAGTLVAFVVFITPTVVGFVAR